ncbi:hypothetical protein HLB35_00525 [Halomonas sp. TBZ9]|uniref:Uncharacterized protein n=1 Tax=Vreelandella azerica TaxID=2732867 RepID=A0A7Y3X9U1_9GAMM|nr:hypothetical protein [Halomonas azerica]NOG30631.1 hypothetical protein [Halomonas azerica]
MFKTVGQTGAEKQSADAYCRIFPKPVIQPKFKGGILYQKTLQAASKTARKDLKDALSASSGLWLVSRAAPKNNWKYEVQRWAAKITRGIDRIIGANL